MAAILWYRQRRMLRRERLFRDRRNPIDLFDDVELYAKFRFRRQDILLLCDELDIHLRHESRRGGALPVVLQVCLTLRFFATGTFQDAVGEMIGVTQSTVSRTVQKVMDALLTLMPIYMKPPTAAEVIRNKEAFKRKAGFPEVFASIDGSHVWIQSPCENKDTYVNRKNYHSVNVQICCDATLKIIDCVAKSPGSFHDARILRASALFRGMERQPRRVAGIILGDSGYPIREWLMTPFGNPASVSQERYNWAHKKTRVTIERCIGVLKRRFHCLHTELRMRPERCSKVIYCSALLHNKAVALNLPPPPDNDNVSAGRPKPPGGVPTSTRGTDHAATVAGQAVRDLLVRNHF